ncbi:hypothetical protein [Mesorhizobium sp. M9A.F.Ca.ET.002.03.1.2]|uniref:hypothetical protein n=1 Tax=Mesorhizobium sp. M9A.F.Ca.ET.002.03.1.2 TaxID=2493668 RepID=UPI0032AE87BB
MLRRIEVDTNGSGEFVDVETRSVKDVEIVRNGKAVMLRVGQLAGSENAERRRLGRRRSCDIRLDDVVGQFEKRIQGRVDNRAIDGHADIAVRQQKAALTVFDTGVCLRRQENQCSTNRN